MKHVDAWSLGLFLCVVTAARGGQDSPLTPQHMLGTAARATVTDQAAPCVQKNLKHRAIVGVCNQASPNFDRGLMARDPSGENLAEARPMMALAATSSGFQIYEVDIDMRTIRVRPRSFLLLPLSEEVPALPLGRRGICLHRRATGLQ